MNEDRRKRGYLATVGAVALGSGTAGVVGLILGFFVGLLFVGTVAVVLFDGRPNESQTDTLINLVPVVVGVPCIALGTALATYALVERREHPGWTPSPVYSSGRYTVWAATVLNAATFGLVALLGPDLLFTLMFRPWLWPLYVFPVGVLARFIALRLSPSPDEQAVEPQGL